MSDIEQTILLNLLVPWDLPIEHKLSQGEAQKLTQALLQLLESLEHPIPREALRTIEQTLTLLESEVVFVVEPTSTKTSLEGWEIRDYDTYFNIQHIQTPTPNLCLVRNILVACLTFYRLVVECQELDPIQIDRQKQGFVSYVHLLARVFALPLEDTDD